jgi:hypothetical protein
LDPRASLDDVEKRKFLTLPGLELRHLGRPARSQSLYRLRSPGENRYCRITIIYNVNMIIHVSTLLRHHKALQENQTMLLNCPNMDPYYDLLSPLS